jgi:hypothetical protein
VIGRIRASVAPARLAVEFTPEGRERTLARASGAWAS